MKLFPDNEGAARKKKSKKERMSMKKNKKGFTLAELLIVVAIIAVLVAISIPVFSTQLEKSREGVDAANIRSAYAEVVAARMGAGNTEYYKAIEIKQHTAGWITSNDWAANLYAADSTTTLKEDNGSTFKPTNAASVYVITAGEGKAYVSTTNGGATDVDTLG